MKKLVALVLICALSLCGCSLFGRAEGGGLADRLSEIDRAAEQETPSPEPEETPEEAPEPTPEPLPDSLSFADIDPYDMLHNSRTLTKEQAQEQYGMAPGESGVDSAGMTSSAPPGTQGGEIVGNYNFSPIAETEFETIWYKYALNDEMPPEDAVRLFRLAVAAADAELAGRNKVWTHQLSGGGDPSFDADSASDQEMAEYAFNEQLSCNWGVSFDDTWYGESCVFSVSLFGYGDHFSELWVEIRYSGNFGEAYFPDDATESAASEEAERAAAEENPPAVYTEPPGSSTAVDMVRLGTYANYDVFGIGLVWSVTFYEDYTFEFSYDHEEGTEYYTGNWQIEDNGGELRVILNITGSTPFTISLDVDGGKYIAFDDGEFWPDIVSLPFVG